MSLRNLAPNLTVHPHVFKSLMKMPFKFPKPLEDHLISETLSFDKNGQFETYAIALARKIDNVTCVQELVLLEEKEFQGKSENKNLLCNLSHILFMNLISGVGGKDIEDWITQHSQIFKHEGAGSVYAAWIRCLVTSEKNVVSSKDLHTQFELEQKYKPLEKIKI